MVGVFLDLVQEDLQEVNWMAIGSDNFMKEERKDLTELQNDESVIIKPSDKGGNVVLLLAKRYEREVHRLLSDSLTYSKFDSNPFQALVVLISDKLFWALEADLITKKEFNYLRVEYFNNPTFYIIPKIHKNQENPQGGQLSLQLGVHLKESVN